MRVERCKSNIPYILVCYIIICNIVNRNYCRILNLVINSIEYRLVNSSLYIKLIVVKLKFSYINRVILSKWSNKPASFKFISKSTKLANLRAIISRKRLDSIRLYNLELHRRRRLMIKLRLKLSKGKVSVRKSKLKQGD